MKLPCPLINLVFNLDEKVPIHPSKYFSFFLIECRLDSMLMLIVSITYQDVILHSTAQHSTCYNVITIKHWREKNKLYPHSTSSQLFSFRNFKDQHFILFREFIKLESLGPGSKALTNHTGYLVLKI